MQEREQRHEVLAEVAREAGALGVDLVDVAANVDLVAGRVTDQAATFEELSASADEILRNNHLVAESAGEVGATAKTACEEVEASRARVDASIAEIGALVDAVEATADSLGSLSDELDGIRGLAAAIDDIAKQTHLLALNARIEAARSESPGFAVIAEEVRKLSDRTIASAAEVDETLAKLANRVTALVEQSRTSRAGAESAGEQTRSIAGLIDQVSNAMENVGGQAEQIATAAEATDAQVAGFRDALVDLTDGVAESGASLEEARDQVNRLLGGAERLIQTTARSGAETVDSLFVRAVVDTAAQVSALFEEALESGEIGEAELWDTDVRARSRQQSGAGDDPLRRVHRPRPAADPGAAARPRRARRLRRRRRPQRLPADAQPQVLEAAGLRPGLERGQLPQPPDLRRPHRPRLRPQHRAVPAPDLPARHGWHLRPDEGRLGADLRARPPLGRLPHGLSRPVDARTVSPAGAGSPAHARGCVARARA